MIKAEQSVSNVAMLVNILKLAQDLCEDLLRQRKPNGQKVVHQEKRQYIRQQSEQLLKFYSKLKDGCTEQDRLQMDISMQDEDYMSYNEILRLIADMTSRQRNEVENYCTKLKQRKLIEITT